MVFERVLAFLRRHRRKFLFLGLATAGGCVCVRYLLRKWKELNEEKVSDVLAQVRKECLFESNEKTYWTTVSGTVPALRAALVSELNCEALAAVLKTKPENKAQLWSQLKCMALTRMVVAVYSTCLMATALRVQLSLLGGYLFVDGLRRVSPTAGSDCLGSLGRPESSSGQAAAAAAATASSDVSLSSAVQRTYLESLHHLLHDGLCNLIQAVTNAVHGHVSSLPLNKPLTYTDVRKILDRIRAAVEGDDSRLGNRAHRLIAFLLPAEEVDEGAVALTADEIALKKIMNETRDILESADYHMVLGASLDRGFSLLLDGIGSIYRKHAAETTAAGSTGTDTVSACYSTVTVPLAKIISQGAGLTLLMLADGSDGFVQNVVQLDCIRAFGHNLYEAFCQANT